MAEILDEDRKANGVTSPFFDDVGEPLARSAEDGTKVENWEEKAEEVDAPETSKEVTGDGLADYFMAEFLKGDGEGDGDDEPSLGRGVTLDDEMIENPHLKSQSEMLAMDSKHHAEKIEAPDYIEGYLEIKALHNPPKDTKKPYALNFIEDKWEYFDTEEERKEFIDNQRRLRQKTSQEDARAWMEQVLPKIVAHIRGKEKNTTNPSGRGRRKRLNDEAADAIESAFGVGQDALDPNDPDFWMKHDRVKIYRNSETKNKTSKLDLRMVEFRDLLAKKFPGKDAVAIMAELGKIKTAKEQEAYLRKMLKGI